MQRSAVYRRRQDLDDQARSGGDAGIARVGVGQPSRTGVPGCRQGLGQAAVCVEQPHRQGAWPRRRSGVAEHLGVEGLGVSLVKRQYPRSAVAAS